MDSGGRVERFQRRLEKAAPARRAPAASRCCAMGRLRVSYGGQAVLEGVMMRGPSCWAVAVRTPDGGIEEVVRDVVARRCSATASGGSRSIRGVIALGESLAIGFRALAISANVAAQEEDEEGDGRHRDLARTDHLLVRHRDRVRADALQGRAGAPHELAADRRDDWFVIVEGLIRVAVFVAYIGLIGLLPDLRRVFQYHGAEHKTINALEGGLGADARESAEVQFDPSSLRNSFFAMGDGDRRSSSSRSSGGRCGTG